MGTGIVFDRKSTFREEWICEGHLTGGAFSGLWRIFTAVNLSGGMKYYWVNNIWEVKSIQVWYSAICYNTLYWPVVAANTISESDSPAGKGPLIVHLRSFLWEVDTNLELWDLCESYIHGWMLRVVAHNMWLAQRIINLSKRGDWLQCMWSTLGVQAIVVTSQIDQWRLVGNTRDTPVYNFNSVTLDWRTVVKVLLGTVLRI